MLRLIVVMGVGCGGGPGLAPHDTSDKRELVEKSSSGPDLVSVVGRYCGGKTITPLLGIATGPEVVTVSSERAGQYPEWAVFGTQGNRSGVFRVLGVEVGTREIRGGYVGLKRCSQNLRDHCEDNGVCTLAVAGAVTREVICTTPAGVRVGGNSQGAFSLDLSMLGENVLVKEEQIRACDSKQNNISAVQVVSDLTGDGKIDFLFSHQEKWLFYVGVDGGFVLHGSYAQK